MKIREPQVKDLFMVARMLAKMSKGARFELASMLASANKEKTTGKEKGKKINPTELGMVFFQSLFIEAEEDLKAWLADLAGVDAGEFDVMPATTVLDVIEGLIEQKGIKDFFARASSLANQFTDKT